MGRWLSLREASAYSRLSADTLRRLIRRGKVAASRPSPRRLVLAEQDLDAYLRSCCVGRPVDPVPRVRVRDYLS